MPTLTQEDWTVVEMTLSRANEARSAFDAARISLIGGKKPTDHMKIMILPADRNLEQCEGRGCAEHYTVRPAGEEPHMNVWVQGFTLNTPSR